MALANIEPDVIDEYARSGIVNFKEVCLLEWGWALTIVFCGFRETDLDAVASSQLCKCSCPRKV